MPNSAPPSSVFNVVRSETFPGLFINGSPSFSSNFPCTGDHEQLWYRVPGIYAGLTISSRDPCKSGGSTGGLDIRGPYNQGGPDGVFCSFTCVDCPASHPVWDWRSGVCLDVPCPDGTLFCEVSGTCISPDTPLCPDWAVWNAETCQYEWDFLCPEGTQFSFVTCDCEPCTADECWCEPEWQCVECSPDDIPCREERGCVWNESTCAWDCTESLECDPGECYSLVDCECVSECPTGTQCCDGICIDADDPPCKTERSCTWNGAECRWDCTTPECDPGEFYSLATCQCEPGWDGIDLAQFAVTWVACSHLEDADVTVERTRDMGETWEGGVVASDAEPGHVATLAIDRHDHAYVFYHNATDDLRVWRSRDLAGTWDDFLTKTDLAYRHPRACFGIDGALYLALWDGGASRVKVYRSEDYGTTIALVFTGPSDATEEQLASLEVDRRGFLHLYYRNDSGGVEHVRSKGASPQAQTDWEAEEALLIGSQDYGSVTPPVGTDAISAALGTFYGVLGHQEYAADGGSSFVFLTNTTYQLPAPAEEFQTFLPLPDGLEFTNPQYLGVLVDHREYVWVMGKLATGGGGGIGSVQGGGGGLGEV